MPRKSQREKSQPAEIVMMRLQTETAVIEKASKACGDKNFRDTLGKACGDYLDLVEHHLMAAGCTPIEEQAKYKVRPVGLETHRELDRVATATGVSRAALIRCCLVLLGRKGQIEPLPDPDKINRVLNLKSSDDELDESSDTATEEPTTPTARASEEAPTGP